MIELLELAILVYLAGSLIALCILSFRAKFVWKRQAGDKIPKARQLIIIALCTSWLYVYDMLDYAIRSLMNKSERK